MKLRLILSMLCAPIMFMGAMEMPKPQAAAAYEFVVVIDDLVKKVNEEKSECRVETWGNKPENSCACCILKKARAVINGKAKAGDVIKECLKNGLCTEEHIKKLMPDDIRKQFEKSKEGQERDTLYKLFITNLYGRLVAVKRVELGNLKTNDKGFLDTASVGLLLEKAYNEGKLPHDAFRSAQCMQVKSLTEELKDAPWATLQLFAVKSTCSGKEESFIIKEMKDPVEEVYRLVRGAKYAPLHNLIYPNELPNYPQFLFPLAYLGYRAGDKIHQLALLNTASGTQLVTLMKRFQKTPHDPNLIKEIHLTYEGIGAQMARFYRAYMQKTQPGHLGKTIIHGDFHQGNIFYDMPKHKLSLIDNERVINSVDKPADVAEDVNFLLLKSLFVRAWINPKFFDGFDLKAWYEASVPAFISGFVSMYSPAEHSSIVKELVQRIRSSDMYTDKQALKSFNHKQYMDPILNKLVGESPNAQVSQPVNPKVSKAEPIDVHAVFKDKENKTLLHLDAANKPPARIGLLLQLGANVNARDDHQNTPLHEAAYFNNTPVIETLVEAGADINAKDRNGDTPLHKAYFNKSQAAINKLIQLGANQEIKDNVGKTPRQM